MKKKKKNKLDNSIYPNKEMEKETTNNVSQNTKETFENVQLTSEIETEEVEKDSQLLEASVINSNNVKEKIESFRRNKSLCRIAAATVSVIVAVVAFCIVGKPLYMECRSDISLVSADTEFVNALQSKGFNLHLNDTIRLQKDSTVTLATIKKIDGDLEISSNPTELAPLDMHLTVKVKPSEDLQTKKAIGSSMLLLCVFLSLIAYIVAYDLISVKKMRELCALLDAKNAKELEEKIKGLKDDIERKEEKIEELNETISAKEKEKEIEDKITSISRLQKVNESSRNAILIEDIRGIKSFDDIQDKESALHRINDLVDSELKAQRMVFFINETLKLEEPVTLDKYEFVLSNIRKGEESKVVVDDQKMDFDHFVRDCGQDNIKTIWKDSGKDMKKFFEKIAKRIKPQQEYCEKDFLARLKCNGFENIIVDNTTISSLWDKVKGHFEQVKKESEKKLKEQKEGEIAAKDAELKNLKTENEQLFEKIKRRAKSDLCVELTVADDASMAFDEFCTSFKSMKDDLSIISKLRDLLGLPSDENIKKESLRNDINNAVAQQLISGCTCLDGVISYDGIKPKLKEIGSQLNVIKQQAEKSEERINNEMATIKDAIKSIFDVEITGDSMENCFSVFQNKTKETIEGLNSAIADKDSKIEDYEQTIGEQGSKIAELNDEVKDRKQDIQDISKKYVIRLQKDVSTITKVVRDNWFLCATLKDGGFASKLDIIYGKVENGAEQLLGKVQELKSEDEVKPKEMFKRVQNLLSSEINDASGFINLIAQYYAYSRLPFMSDQNAEYGLQFNRAGIKKIYEAVVHMLAGFNITLQIPTLYAEYDKDWEYENVTGKAQKGLDFLIPDAANHVNSVDNSSKEGLILDFSEVGYAIDGHVEKQTKIIL